MIRRCVVLLVIGLCSHDALRRFVGRAIGAWLQGSRFARLGWGELAGKIVERGVPLFAEFSI